MPSRRPRSPRWRGELPRSARSTRTRERNQWSALALDLETDRRSFQALDATAQSGMVWIFAHRFHAEFSVARLLASFLLAAPTYDVQLLLATQVTDEHRQLQARSGAPAGTARDPHEAPAPV